MHEEIANKEFDAELLRRFAVAGGVAAIIGNLALTEDRIGEGRRPNHLQRDREFVRAFLEAAAKRSADLADPRRPILLRKHIERGEASRGRDRIAVERAAHIDRTSVTRTGRHREL